MLMQILVHIENIIRPCGYRKAFIDAVAYRCVCNSFGTELLVKCFFLPGK